MGLSHGRDATLDEALAAIEGIDAPGYLLLRARAAGHLFGTRFRDPDDLVQEALLSIIEGVALLHNGEGPIEATELPKRLLTTDTVIRSFRSGPPTLKELEQVYILWVLENSRGTKADVARTLGISRKSLWEKCKRFGIVTGRSA